MTRFFVVGPPKTGTTVLTRLLAQHPDVTCLSESYVLEPNNPSSLANPESDKWAMHGFTREDAARWGAAFARGPVPAALREVLEDAWARMARESAPRVAGDSWPYYHAHLPALKAAYPDAKYVYSTRDPRATYWSGQTFRARRQGLWITSQLLGADRTLKPFLANEARPGHALVVKYEALVRDPRAVLERIWSFLEVDPALGWVDYDAARDPWPQRWAWVSNATSPLDPSRIDHWQDEITPRERRIVGLASAEYCAAYGYPVELDETYGLEEMVAAFLCGGSLSHYPSVVEDHVRQELIRRLGSPNLARAGAASAATPAPAA